MDSRYCSAGLKITLALVLAGGPASFFPCAAAGQAAVPACMNQSAENSESQPAALPNYREPVQGRIVYIPAGLRFPVRLAGSLTSQVSRPGDIIMARTEQNIVLANGMIPANTVLIGQVTDASAGTWLTRSGSMGIKFNMLRMPNGADTPISAHITGHIGKYADAGKDTFRGENSMSKVKKTLVATTVGAGSGAALGVAVGAVAAGKRGVGRGAWSGTAMGAGLGLAESLLLRKGAEVNLEQGQTVNLELDAPVNTAVN